ncbi:MAG: CoB--CoM heterodisulfide reductase iron-sulfur subunit A family protein [Candidatus Heimdallarchaeota archaeon]|nr:CoB--CoM heterodisulfide reductase iron-sulfur subunit A family protein [Candidatus Heimdallarchaeota archaeon]
METYDSIVIGAGIAGIQAALDLADQGYKILLVDKEPSIGGKMIQLSKVFPTLDCASCITTPKMSSAAHHENITVWTYCEVTNYHENESGSFQVNLIKKARLVNENKCIGCRQCEFACPVEVPSEFEMALGARKAIYIPFQTAIPQIALLDLENCIACGTCHRVCPADAIDYLQQDQNVEIEAESVILATGYELTPLGEKAEWGGGKYLNVISSLAAERLLAPNGPYLGVRRPSDNQIPMNIAYVHCAGSRDASVDRTYCSRICCMYTIKQAMLIMGSLPIVGVTCYYMDIRAFGKGYEQFYQNAKAMGVEFVKGKVGEIRENPKTHNLILSIENIGDSGGKIEVEYELVVLSLGLTQGSCPTGNFPVKQDKDGFIQSPKLKLDPVITSMEGIIAAGTALGPKDIVDTIVEGSAAAIKTSNYLKARQKESASILSLGSIPKIDNVETSNSEE